MKKNPVYLILLIPVIISLLFSQNPGKLGEGELAAWQFTTAYRENGTLLAGLLNMETGAIIHIINGFEYEIEAAGKKIKSKGNTGMQTGISDNVYFAKVPGIFERTFILQKTGNNSINLVTRIKAETDLKYIPFDAYLNSGLIKGKEFYIDGKTEKMIIETEPLKVNDRFRVGGNDAEWKTILFHTDIGKITISFKQQRKLVDFRAVPWATIKNHIIYNPFSIAAGTTWEDTMTINIEPDSKGLKNHKEENPQQPWFFPKNKETEFTGIITPVPKKIIWDKGELILNGKILCTHNITDRRITDFLAEKYREFGISLEFKQITADRPVSVLVLGGNGQNVYKNITGFFEQELLKIKNAEKYAILVRPEGAGIAAETEKGIWSGVQTLLQTSIRQWTGNKLKLAQLTIADWPDFSERNIYIRIGQDADLDFIRNFFDQSLLWKYNRVYLEFRYAYDIKRFPELNFSGRGYPITEEQLSSLITFMKSRPVELIPIWHGGKLLAQITMKHVSAFPKLERIVLKNPKFKNDGIAHHYDLSLDETFAFNIEKCDYFLKLTGADKIHIALDEVYEFPKFAEKNTGRGDIILSEYINKFTGYYSPKGIKVIIYHDMFFDKDNLGVLSNADRFPANAHSGSEKALALLNNKSHLEIEYWDYADSPVFPALDLLLAQGIKTTPGVWFREQNIKNLPLYAYNRGVRSMTTTIWCSISTDAKRNWQLKGQVSGTQKFPTYIFLPAVNFASEIYWNVQADKYNYNVWKETIALYDRRTGTAPEIQTAVDISSYVNRSLTDKVFNDKEGFIDSLPGEDLRNFPCGRTVLSGIQFNIAQKNNEPYAVSVKGKYTATLPVNTEIKLPSGNFNKIIFLHACAYDRDEAADIRLDASYLVRYTDGSTQEIPLLADKNIILYSPPVIRADRSNNNLWCAWIGNTIRNEFPACVYAWEWVNPQPAKPVSSISMQSLGNNASVFLIGLTCIP